MANYNKVILAGNLTRDPELTYTPSNMAVCKFGLAVNRSYNDRDGNKKEDVCFVDCTAWGRQAEVINQYLRKGRGIMLDGRLQYSTWTGKDEQKRSKLEVVVESFQFLGGRPDGGGPGGERGQSSGNQGQDPGAGSDDNYRYPSAPSPTDVPF